MASAQINVRRTWTPELKQSMIGCLGLALVEALKVPANHWSVRLIEYAPEDFAVPPAATEYFTLVEVDLSAGRSSAVKQALHRAIVENLSSLGIPPTQIKILLRESPPED